MSTEREKLAAAVRGKLVGRAEASARQYSLRQGDDGKMTCTCGDYKFRQGPADGECKHIKAHRSSGARAPSEMLRDHVKAAGVAREYAAHSALNLGQAARDLRYLHDHPDADKVAPKGTAKHVASSVSSRIPSLASNLYYTALPPHLHHTVEELKDLNKDSLKEWFLRGYNPWDHPMKTAGAGTYKNFFTGETRRDATFFPPGTMSKSTAKIVAAATNKEYAPKGIGSAISWINYYANRAGKKLDAEQRARIDAAKKILSKKLQKEHDVDRKKEGAEAALAKYAIEFKSPKMQQVLQGAIDKVYANAASPRAAIRRQIPGVSRTMRRENFNEDMLQAGALSRMKTKPATNRSVDTMLLQAHSDGNRAYRERIEAFRKGTRTPNTTPPELASSIGRPKEKAIRAALSLPTAQTAGGTPGKHYARSVRPTNRKVPDFGDRPLAQLLNDINYHRRVWPDINPVGGVTSAETYTGPTSRALLFKHTPDLLPPAVQAGLRKNSKPPGDPK